MTTSTNTHATQKWWKESVVYQVYPSSFFSTGSGTPGWGDVRGITSKLDYLKDLGVDIVWSSPILKSPQVDMGYDISDYKDIDPNYGTLADVDELFAELKKKGMKFMFDIVVNHTSDKHDWFLQSRSSKDSPYRDWYIWQPPKYDEAGNRKPPNNWSMTLGEANSAWAWDEKTQEYYLALFTAEQPDLNWRNSKVREAVHDILRFWLDRGASGFRMDVINLISKVEGYPDAPIKDETAEFQPGSVHFANGPHLHEYLQEINKEVLSHYDTITVGEMPFVRDEDEIIRVVGADRKELNMIFIFELVDIDNTPGTFRMTLHDWKPNDIRDIVSRYQRLMIERNGWNSIFISNHDNPRPVSRYTSDSDEYREISAKLLCLMQTTLSGTLYVYQGEEIGMRNLSPDVPAEEYLDIESENYWKKIKRDYSGNPNMLEHGRNVLQRKARDHARTPVQWSKEPNAGFCAPGTKPWMIVNDDYVSVNVEAQQAPRVDGDLSVLHFWKKALGRRKEKKEVFVYGDFELLDDQHDSVFAYKRRSPKEAFVVVLNFKGEAVEWDVPEKAQVSSWVVGNYQAGVSEKKIEGTITLKPYEGLIGKGQP